MKKKFEKRKFRKTISLFTVFSMLIMMTSLVFASTADVSVVDVTAPTGSVTLPPSGSGNITINLSVTGKQEGTATFEVYRDWTLNNGTFVGSNPQEFSVAPRAAQDPTTTFSTTGTVSVASTQAEGTFTLSLGVFDITNSNSTGAKLSAGNSGNYVVTVEKPVVILPLVTADSSTVTINEGQTATNTGTWTNATDLNASIGNVVKNAGGTWSWSYPTTDGPSQSDNVTITAVNGTNTSTIDFGLVVNNVAPSVTAPSDQTADEGTSKSFALGSFTDPGTNDTPWAVTVNWGDGTDATFNETSVGNITDKTHTYADNGEYTVTVTVKDKDNGSDSKTFKITVANVAPTVTAPSDQTADEGTSKSFTLGSFADPGPDSPWAVEIDWGDGTAATTFNATATGSLGNKDHTYADNGTYTVTVKVTDKDNGSDSKTFKITVANVAPSVGAINGPIDPVKVGTSINFSADFTDPGTVDTHTALWDWGDSSTTSANLTLGSRTASGTHAYVEAGIYTVTLTITDKDGGYDSSIFTYVVVYDPSAGFVTGGGWIDSPAGAYAADPTLSGKANFGFVSKYQKGATVPTGNTEFQFKAGSLNFSSTSYQWLVVAGSKAQYKGSGTINGTGDYGFMLTAIDGGKTGADKFRIKIWDKSSGSVVYDNMMGASETADPTTGITGSIVIHK